MAGRPRHRTCHSARKNGTVQYEYDRAIYRQRNVVERMFCHFKDWLRIAARIERNIKNFMGVISFALPSSGGCHESGPETLRCC